MEVRVHATQPIMMMDLTLCVLHVILLVQLVSQQQLIVCHVTGLHNSGNYLVVSVSVRVDIMRLSLIFVPNVQVSARHVK